MAITTAMCTSFKVESWQAIHDITVSTGDAFKLALYVAAATLSAATTAYSTTNEATGTGYTAGGGALTNVTPISIGTTALADFADLVFSTASITARGCEIYNSTDANRAVSVHDFGEDKTATAGDFTVQFPTADASSAILRLA